MNARFEPPTVKERGEVATAVAKAMYQARLAMERGAREGKLSCGCCGSTVRWSGSGTRSAGSCVSCPGVRWAT